MNRTRRYVVYGAGAVGGVVGARLAEAGLDVVLIARGDHLLAIRDTGLTLETPRGSTTLRIPVVAHPSALAFSAANDVVLLATKTQDGAAALDALREATASDVPVVCLQNGVASPRIALRRFPAVYGAMVLLPSAYVEPGGVQAFSAPVPGVLDVGRHPAGTDSCIA